MNRQTTDAPTRRHLISGAVLLAGCAWAGEDADGVSRTAESIHQAPVFQATRKRLYEALTDSQQFARIEQLSSARQSGMALGNKPTQISRQAGGEFTIYGGYIFGRQIELTPDQRIVQSWRVVNWTPGIYSIAKFELVEQGSATRIVFDHTGFPQGLAQHLASGWTANYWAPLRKFLA
jgi:activator of HSP90 ATPase